MVVATRVCYEQRQAVLIGEPGYSPDRVSKLHSLKFGDSQLLYLDFVQHELVVFCEEGNISGLQLEVNHLLLKLLDFDRFCDEFLLLSSVPQAERLVLTQGQNETAIVVDAGSLGLKGKVLNPFDFKDITAMARRASKLDVLRQLGNALRR